MILLSISTLAFLLALGPAVLFFKNIKQFRTAPSLCDPALSEMRKLALIRIPFNPLRTGKKEPDMKHLRLQICSRRVVRIKSLS